MLIRLLALSLLLSACGSATGSAPGSQSQTAISSPTETKAAATGRFDGLTIRLDLNASTVSSGEELGSRLTVRNDSGETIVDRACVIGAGAYALVPLDDPDAELWLQPVVDCSGVFRMPDGFVERSDGPTFPARTKYGDALPPGEYIATLEIEGYSERLEEPVEVTE